MLSFIIGFLIGSFAGITLICLVQVAKSGDEIESNVEEIDYTTIYLSGFYNGEDKWKDKIKSKKEELRKEYENCRREDTFKKAKILYQRNILEEVLEEGCNNTQ